MKLIALRTHLSVTPIDSTAVRCSTDPTEQASAVFLRFGSVKRLNELSQKRQIHNMMIFIDLGHSNLSITAIQIALDSLSVGSVSACNCIECCW